MARIVRYATVPAPDRFFDRFDRLVQSAFAPSAAVEPPRRGIAANLYETEESYWVELPVPGVRPEDLEVSVKQNLLALQAKRSWATPEGARTLWQGFAPTEWRKTFTLPGEVDAERVEARLEHGILHLQLPKASHTRPRQIKVQSGAAPAAETVVAESAPAAE